MKKLENILIPVDGSRSSMKGLKLSLSIAKETKSKITAVHVIRNSFELNFPISSKIKRIHRKNAERIILEVQKIAEKNKVSLVGKILQGNNIGREIIKFADNKNIDLIIVGSRGPNQDEVFLGSVANYILHKSKIPITIVR